MQKVTPFLWYDTQAEEAANFYTSIFPDSKITSISRYGPEGPGPEGSVMVCNFELFGQEFMALNGGPQFPFTNAVSFMVKCDTQDEIDHYWEKLTEGGKEIQCGWLTDKFGLSWQITPAAFGDILESADAAGKTRFMNAMMGMVKLDIAELKRAAQGDPIPS